MKYFLRLYEIIHGVIALFFVVASVLLVAIACLTSWHGMSEGIGGAAHGLIEGIGLIAIAAVALQIAQTITEEEIVREAHVSAPTRVRRYLSRFMVVVVVALAIEGLVATFQILHDNPEQLPNAASILIATGVLLAGWGVFIRFNKEAEVLEPEAMAKAKKEDEKLEQGTSDKSA